MVCGDSQNLSDPCVYELATDAMRAGLRCEVRLGSPEAKTHHARSSIRRDFLLARELQ